MVKECTEGAKNRRKATVKIRKQQRLWIVPIIPKVLMSIFVLLAKYQILPKQKLL